MKDRATFRLVRKEKPLPPAKPPALPPTPTGIRAPGGGGAGNGIVCPGPGR